MMATDSDSDTVAGANFTLLIQLLSPWSNLLLLLLVAGSGTQGVLSESTCGQICPSSGSHSGWNRMCEVQSTITRCGFIPQTSSIPTAPMSLHLEEHIFSETERRQTLALNISWQLPVNATGLKGFVVELLNLKQSGSPMCKVITFSKELELDPKFTSPVIFSLQCWHYINVDSVYRVTVTSLDSGQNVSRRHHTMNCYDVPGVETCQIDCQNSDCPQQIPAPDNWTPRNNPTATVYGDRVVVEFDVYPGNYWLVYRVNLFSFELGTTPQELSHHVNSSGRSGKYQDTFNNVNPGTYKAEVIIAQGDPIQVSSERFNVSALPTPPIRAEVTETSKQERDDTKIFVGVAVGVAAAVVILVVLVIAKGKRLTEAGSHHEAVGANTPSVSSPSGDGVDLVNNMVHNDVEPTFGPCMSDKWGQVVCQDHTGIGDSYLQGSYWTDFSDTPCVHSVPIPDMSKLADLVSVGGESGIPV